MNASEIRSVCETSTVPAVINIQTHPLHLVERETEDPKYIGIHTICSTPFFRRRFFLYKYPTLFLRLS